MQLTYQMQLTYHYCLCFNSVLVQLYTDKIIMALDTEHWMEKNAATLIISSKQKVTDDVKPSAACTRRSDGGVRCAVR